MHTPTDMVSEATTVSTAAHPTPHFDFTWLILPARAAGDGRPLDDNKKTLPNDSQVPTPKPLPRTHSQTTPKDPLPNHSQGPTPKPLTHRVRDVDEYREVEEGDWKKISKFPGILQKGWKRETRWTHTHTEEIVT